MLKPFRLRVLEALTAHLEGVTIAAGYQHDLAGRVFRGRSTFSADAPVPMLAILERDPEGARPTRSSPPRSGTIETRWDLLVQGWVQDDSAHPSDLAYYLSADVMRRLYEARTDDIFEMRGRVADLEVHRCVVRPPEDRSALAMFWCEINLHIFEDARNPFI